MGRIPKRQRRRNIDVAKLEAAGQLKLLELPRVKRAQLDLKALERPIWTENKAKLIQRYLYYFVQITKHGSYIDGFAGPQRISDAANCSANLVLASSPKWLRHFFLCELKPAPYDALQKLRADQQPVGKGRATRTIELFRGDFNDVVPQILKSPHLTQKEATFCLLDQRTFECHWTTVETLARHKTAEPKVELFYFLACAWFDRALSAIKQTRILDRWWGRGDWGTLRGKSDFDRALIVRDRMIDDLGYKFATPYPIYSRKHSGRVMYYMVHATDHDVAPELMTRAYNRAVAPLETGKQLSLLIEEARAGDSPGLVVAPPIPGCASD